MSNPSSVLARQSWFMEPGDLRPLVEAFAGHLSGLGHTELTVSGYHDSARHFADWLRDPTSSWPRSTLRSLRSSPTIGAGAPAAGLLITFRGSTSIECAALSDSWRSPVCVDDGTGEAKRGQCAGFRVPRVAASPPWHRRSDDRPLRPDGHAPATCARQGPDGVRCRPDQAGHPRGGPGELARPRQNDDHCTAELSEVSGRAGRLPPLARSSGADDSAMASVGPCHVTCRPLRSSG